MNCCLIINSADASSELLARLLPDSHTACVLRWPEDQSFLAGFDHWVVYLDDPELRALLTANRQTEAVVHLLTHPQSRHGCRGFCLPPKSGPLPDDFQQRTVVNVDLLFCNDLLVLNKAVIGKAFNYQPGGHSKNLWQRLQSTWHQLRHLRDYRPQPFKLTTANETQIETAAVGITTTAHVLNSGLSKNLLTENYANDGLFYSLIVAPKSIQEMLNHVVLESLSRASKQPGFIGVLRSKQLLVESPVEFECRLDEQTLTERRAVFEVHEKSLRLAVDATSPLLNTGARHKETRKIKQLPSAQESVTALSGDPLPWITHAATEDFRELYQQLRENAKVSSTFLIFMVLSTLLASFGLYANSAPVIIGAMILAPLMAPIVSLAMAFTRQDENLMVASAKTLFIGFAMAVGFAMLLSFWLPLQIETSEISARLRPTLLDLGIAIISGIASAYAYARAQAAKSLAGVAIAVALVPPLAVVGIGLGWLSFRVAGGALLLFVTNLAGIVFSASATFLLLGFAPFSRARKGIVTALISVALVSIPLAVSFHQLAKEASIVWGIEHLPTSDLEIRSVKVLGTQVPARIYLEVVSSGLLDNVKIRRLKSAIEDELEMAVELEVNWITLY